MNKVQSNTIVSSDAAGMTRWANFQTTYAKQVADHFPLFCGVIGLLAVVGAVAAVGGGLGALGKGPISQACRALPPSFRLPGCLVLTAGGVTGLTVALLGILPIAYGRGMNSFEEYADNNDTNNNFSLTGKIFLKMESIAESSWAEPTSGFWRHHVGVRLGYGATSILLTIASLWDLLVGAGAGVVTLATVGKHPGARCVSELCIKNGKGCLVGGMFIFIAGMWNPVGLTQSIREKIEE